MQSDSDDHLVRYLLGELPDDEAERLDERSNTDDAFALRLRELENDLVDRYVRGGPFDPSLTRFERAFRTSPYLRDKVRFAQALSALPGRAASGQRRVSSWVMPIAASLVILIAAAAWFLTSRPDRDSVSVQSDPAPAGPSAPPLAAPSEPARSSSSPVVIAVSISPVLVRGAGEPSAITIGKDTDIVRLLLQGTAGEQPARGRAVIGTVAGDEVWRGSVAPIPGSPRGELARVDAPATSLPPDDYIIQLFGTDAAGRDVERHRYFLRVRPQ